jgi:hypothetical protein
MSKPRFRCSELDRLLSCPASHTLNQIVAPRSGDEVAWEGTMLHWETVWRLVKELGASQPDGGLPLPEGVPVGYKLPGYVSWIVGWLFDAVSSEVPQSWALEVEPALEWEFDRWILTGHLDVAATSPDGKESKDFDFKCGRIPVDVAECNEQVGGYIVLRRMNYGIESAKFTIPQPWNDPDEGFERLSEVTIHGADKLDALVATLNHRVCYALDHADELSTGRQCTYCCGLACPAILSLKDLMKMKLTPEMLANVKRTHSDAELVDLFAEARVLTKPIEDLKEQLAGRLEGGKVAVGTSGLTAKVVESPAGYNVVDPVGMFKWLGDHMKPEQMAPCLSYPSTKIRDGLAKALSIPKDGKAPVTAKTVFEGAAAAYLSPKTKKQLVLA